MSGIERRASLIEVRATGGRRLAGYAAVFDTAARIGGFTETILPGAFRASLLARTDVLALMDHDPTRVLARTAAGNLRLSEDTRGLAFEIDLPATTAAADALALVESRTAGGMSFGFTVAPGGDAWPTADRRELRAVNLVEISLVSAFPAYASTTVQARGRPASMSAIARRRYLETL